MDTSNTELTPMSFLRRSATVYADKPAVVHGGDSWSYQEFAAQVEQRARMLRAAGVKPGDRVAYLMPNTPEMLAAHFAVPLAGAVPVAINTRLAADEVRYILDHCAATVLVVDSEYAATVAPIATSLQTVCTIAVAVDPHGPHGPHAVSQAGRMVEIAGAVPIADLLAGAAADEAKLVWTAP